LSATTTPRALLLIDRDGTMIEERDYLGDPAGVALLARTVRAFKLMAEQNLACAVCTNQSGIARGKFTEADLERVHDRLKELLAAEGVAAPRIYHCAAAPDSADPRRKPAPGMAKEAIRDLGLAGVPVFSIGDKAIDVEFGRNAGGEGILVRTGYGAKAEGEVAEGTLVADDLYDAVRIVLNELDKSEWPEDGVLASKLRTPGEMRRIAKAEKDAGRKVVFANGCFDLLHGGHISFLENSRAAGDALVLGVNSNASISRLKGKGRPLLDQAARLQLLAAFACVDYLTVFYTDSADEPLEEILPEFHAKGTDYRSDNVPELQTSRRLGIKTVIAGAPKENSTRDIIEVVVERTRSGALR